MCKQRVRKRNFKRVLVRATASMCASNAHIFARTRTLLKIFNTACVSSIGRHRPKSPPARSVSTICISARKSPPARSVSTICISAGEQRQKTKITSWYKADAVSIRMNASGDGEGATLMGGPPTTPGPAKSMSWRLLEWTEHAPGGEWHQGDYVCRFQEQQCLSLKGWQGIQDVWTQGAQDLRPVLQSQICSCSPGDFMYCYPGRLREVDLGSFARVMEGYERGGERDSRGGGIHNGGAGLLRSDGLGT